MSGEDKLVLNGINAVDGQYLTPPIAYGDAAKMIKGDVPDKAEVAWLRRVWRVISQAHLGLPFDVDPTSVRQAGWAIVFHKDEDPAVRSALDPLITQRRNQIGESKVKILEYRPGESRAMWLARHGVGAGSVDPQKVPYYVLLVGGPERIPFSFCHQLAVEYAVGCLQFDGPAEYERYARSVVDYETGQTVGAAKRAIFFGTRHPMDRATQLSADSLVGPLAKYTLPGWQQSQIPPESATKAALLDALAAHDGKGPAFLFTATHGVGWPAGDARQAQGQGALLCQDWPNFTPVKPEHCFSAADIPANAKVHGMIGFHFACYGAGTPAQDRFIHKAGEPPPMIAEKPFIAALPKALLAHPGGGALACIGHVERAWGYSIATPGAGPQLLPFQNALRRITSGQPVGHALRDFNERYAALSTSLSSLLEQVSFGAYVSDRELTSAWIERNDAEGYVVIGDPAVALRVNMM